MPLEWNPEPVSLNRAIATSSRSATTTRFHDAGQHGTHNIQIVGNNNILKIEKKKKQTLNPAAFLLAVGYIVYTYILILMLPTGRIPAADEIMFFAAPLITGAIAAFHIED